MFMHKLSDYDLVEVGGVAEAAAAAAAAFAARVRGSLAVSSCWCCFFLLVAFFLCLG